MEQDENRKEGAKREKKIKNDTGITGRKSRKGRRRIRELVLIHEGKCENRKKERVNGENENRNG